MRQEYPIPQQVKEISRHMKVIYLERVVETKDPWEELTGMFRIGRELSVEDLIKQRWSEYDESLGF
ncbi:MAG: hypothetical protein ACK4HB_01380 [Candidatus Bipolaricaulia bacterium]